MIDAFVVANAAKLFDRVSFNRTNIQELSVQNNVNLSWVDHRSIKLECSWQDEWLNLTLPNQFLVSLEPLNPVSNQCLYEILDCDRNRNVQIIDSFILLI